MVGRRKKKRENLSVGNRSTYPIGKSMTPLNYAAGVCVEIREWGWGHTALVAGGVAGLACHPAICAALP